MRQFLIWAQVKGSREMHRERKALRAVIFPALTRWANFCRAYGAGVWKYKVERDDVGADLAQREPNVSERFGAFLQVSAILRSRGSLLERWSSGAV